MFRGASALESESEMTVSGQLDAVTDEIRRWSFVSVEDGVLNEFEMM